MFRGDLAEEMLGAVIFGMERTTPHRHSSVQKGIAKFAKRTGVEVDTQFFSEHVAIDEYHNNKLVEPIAHVFSDPTRVQRLKQGIIMSFDARKEFLDGLAA